ncbi:MAG: flagellar hook-length control protein FliK [Pseudorhodoplanes sp.]|nr:flagellar hook-length control protein FliK [Pseudorhodoplanes sp.]
MTVIRPVPVSPAALQTQSGQAGQSAPAPQGAAASAPQATATLQAVLSEQKAMLFAVLQQALGEAAPRQGGLAPLMADAEAMLAQDKSSLPLNVKTALQDVLATRLVGQGSVDATKLQNAVRQSGAFLESSLANGQPVQGDVKAALLGLRQALQTWLGTQGAEAAIRTVPNAAPPATPQAQTVPQGMQPRTTPALPQPNSSAAPALKQALSPTPSTPLRDAALRLLAETDAMLERPMAQPVATSNTPLKANLEAMLARTDAPLPQAVRDAIQTVLGQRPAAPATGDALKLQNALQQTALLSRDAAMPPSAGDLKSALLGLRQALQTWLAPKAETSLPVPATSAPAPAHTPAPPLRNGPTVPQPPALPGLAALPLREAGLRLLAETDAALARHTMLQIASLPDDPAAPRSVDNAQRLVLDIPLVTPQGTAIVQLRIERDEKRAAKGKKASVWQAMFSIDTEPLGPVHARVAMVGDTANVSLFAERGDSAAALRDNIPLLQAGLAEAAVEPGDIRCARGAPATPAVASGLFVDRAS